MFLLSYLFQSVPHTYRQLSHITMAPFTMTQASTPSSSSPSEACELLRQLDELSDLLARASSSALSKPEDFRGEF